MYLIPNRIVRSLVSYMGPTKLRYRRLTPNYDVYHSAAHNPTKKSRLNFAKALVMWTRWGT